MFFIVYHFYQIPRDVLLEVLGPSKVYKEVIKTVINSTVAEYVDKVNRIRSIVEFRFLFLLSQII